MSTSRLGRRPRPDGDAELRFVQLTPPGSACSIASASGVDDGAGRIGRSRSRWWWPTPTRRGPSCASAGRVPGRRRQAVGPLRVLRGPGRQRLGAPADRHPRLSTRSPRESPSAAATAASAWVRIESRSGIGESSGRTRSSISVQARTRASEPGSLRRPMMPAYVARECSDDPTQGELVEDDPVHLGRSAAPGRRRSRPCGPAGRRRSPPPSPSGRRGRRAATNRDSRARSRSRRRCGGAARRSRPGRRRPPGA